MNIEELLQSLPSREEIADAVGLRGRGYMRGYMRDSMRDYIGGRTEVLPALGIFGTGMLFGAGLAMLFTPKSGTEMRRELSQRAQEFGSQAKEMAEGMGQSGQGGQHGQSGQTHSTSGQHTYSGGSTSRNV